MCRRMLGHPAPAWLWVMHNPGPSRLKASHGRSKPAAGRVGLSQMPATLGQKLWESHVVRSTPGEPDLLYVDLHLVHEVTSPQAFEGLRLSGRKVRRPDLTLATMDHNVPTRGGARAADNLSRKQMDVLAENCRREGIPLHQIGSRGCSSSAATPTPPPTAPSARSPSESERPRSSSCWPRSAFHNRVPAISP